MNDFITFFQCHGPVSLFGRVQVAHGLPGLGEEEAVVDLLVGKAPEAPLPVLGRDPGVVQETQEVECAALFPVTQALHLFHGTLGSLDVCASLVSRIQGKKFFFIVLRSGLFGLVISPEDELRRI